MKTRLALILALISAVALRAADDLPIFNAILAMGKEHRFVLVAPGGKSSSWLKLGDVFGDYRLKAYDAKAAALDLERDGKITRLTLVADAAIANAPLAPTPATLADAQAVLKAMNFDDMLDKILVQVRKQQSALIDRAMAQLDRPGVDKQALGDLQKKMIDELMTALSPADMKADITRIYSEVFSKDELEGMATFYTTPLGQALSSKQPAVQEKMNAAMTPRIMAAMPKIQGMARDFAMGQQAKIEGGQGAAPAPAPAPTPKP